MDKPLVDRIAQDHATAKPCRSRLFFLPARCALSCMAAALALLPASLAADEFLAITFSAAQLEYGEYELEDARLALEPDGSFHLAARSPSVAPAGGASRDWEFVGRLDRFELASGNLESNGILRYEGLETDWQLNSMGDELSLCLLTPAQALGGVAGQGFLPQQLAWLTGGKIEACVDYRQPGGTAATARIDVAVTGLGFDSPDGRFAAASIALDLSAAVDFSRPEETQVEGRLHNGEILLDRFYADFTRSPVAFDLLPRWNGGSVSGARLRAEDKDSFRLDATFDLPGDEGKDDWALRVDRLELAFPGAYRDYLEAVAAAWSLDGLEVTGSASWQGRLSADGLESGDLDIRDFSVVDTRRSRFALTGLEARLTPGDYRTDSPLSWRGLLLGQINLGPGATVLDPEPGAFALLEPLELGVLGGRLHLDRLKYVLPGPVMEGSGASRFEMQASIEEVDMEQLTAAFGWPTFSGSLSGELPGARLDDGVVSVDGEIRIDVFDGQITVRGLEAERLFGVLPSLSADISLQGLDLERLTETFEFGHISGQVDGHVNGLRMLDWQPVAFDAWLGTPQGQDRSHKISRKAVNHLTRIGGGGAAAALSGPLLKMFSSFSYRRLGLGCRLQNYVCEVRGVSEDGDSVLLMEGAGIPKITVRAWNRNVDWPQMVANLAAVSAGESMSIGEQPR